MNKTIRLTMNNLELDFLIDFLLNPKVIDINNDVVYELTNNLLRKLKKKQIDLGSE